MKPKMISNGTKWHQFSKYRQLVNIIIQGQYIETKQKTF